ncbi:MAG: hypothetical protein MOIL_01342 [Candidatus Methanolliviera sp. GoM_oil]|nr:MAG: hypothetical protein MOIL_01342 [Candidatus Methanolliviera sp. GoM_oil]
MRMIKEIWKDEEAFATCCGIPCWMSCGTILEQCTGLLCGTYGKICLCLGL